MRILIVDDEEIVIENLTCFLNARGHTVSGMTWIDVNQLQRQLDELEPWGVILDFEMATPGDVVFRRLREWRAHLPIVFYTKYALSPDRRIIMEGLGAKDNHIIPKKEIGFAEVDCILAGLESQR